MKSTVRGINGWISLVFVFALLFAVFAAVYFLDANIILVILACGMLGAADAAVRGRKRRPIGEKKEEARS